MKKGYVYGIAAALALVAAGTLAWHVLGPGREQEKTIGPVRLSFARTESASALFVADELGFFAASGVNVTLLPVDSGLDSYKAMLSGKADVSVPAEYIAVGGVFNHDDLQVASTYVKSEFFHILGRKDRGIEKVSDLPGKRIGLQRNTIEEFYLGRYLELNGMKIQDVTLVNMNFSSAPGALEEGNVDAVVTLPPYYAPLKSFFADGAVDWSVQSGQRLFGLVITKKSWAAQNPEALTRFLKAIDQANTYMAQHPPEAKAIVQKRLNIDASSADMAWQMNSYSLSLDQTLIVVMEDEARWMMKNNLTDAKEVPNFLDYIDSNALEAVKPEAVTLIH